MADSLRVAYFQLVEVRKVRSRNVCQGVCEMDISQFKTLAAMDEVAGIFIPVRMNAPEGVYDLNVDPAEIGKLLKQSLSGLEPIEGVASRPSLPGRNSLAHQMHQRGYFFNRELWAAMERHGIWTQDKHYEYVKAMEPVNIYPEEAGTGDVVAHHCRTAANSGTGTKPPHWFCIPIHDSHHRYLHQHATRDQREKHVETAIKITADKMKEEMKRFLGRDTFSGVTMDELAEFEETLGFNSGFTHGESQQPSRCYPPV